MSFYLLVEEFRLGALVDYHEILLPSRNSTRVSNLIYSRFFSNEFVFYIPFLIEGFLIYPVALLSGSVHKRFFLDLFLCP